MVFVLCPRARESPLEVFPSVRQAVRTSSSLRSLAVRTQNGFPERLHGNRIKAVLSKLGVCRWRAYQRRARPFCRAPAPAGRDSLDSPTELAQSGATCGSESSAPWWRPGGPAAAGWPRPDGCDSGVALLTGGRRPSWGSVVGRAAAQLITSCGNPCRPLAVTHRGPGSFAERRSLGFQNEFWGSTCSGWGSRSLGLTAPSDPTQPRQPRCGHSSICPRAGGASTRESQKWGGERPSRGASVRHRVPRLAWPRVPAEGEPEHRLRGQSRGVSAPEPASCARLGPLPGLLRDALGHFCPVS